MLVQWLLRAQLRSGVMCTILITPFLQGSHNKQANCCTINRHTKSSEVSSFGDAANGSPCSLTYANCWNAAARQSSILSESLQEGGLEGNGPSPAQRHTKLCKSTSVWCLLEYFKAKWFGVFWCLFTMWVYLCLRVFSVKQFCYRVFSVKIATP